MLPLNSYISELYLIYLWLVMVLTKALAIVHIVSVNTLSANFRCIGALHTIDTTGC